MASRWPRAGCCWRRAWRRCTPREIAADICLEMPGLDTLDIEVFWKGLPTIASTRTILVNAALAKAYYLEQNEYVEWPADAGLYTVVVPGQHGPGWRCRGAAPASGLVPPRPAGRERQGARRRLQPRAHDGRAADRGGRAGADQGLSDAEKYSALSEQAAAVMNQMPPRENPRINTSWSRSTRPARSAARTASCTATATTSDRCPAGLRRVLAAPAAAAKGRLRIRLPGLRPPRTAGHAARLRPGHGARPHRPALTMPAPTMPAPTMPALTVPLTGFLDKGASLGPAAPCLTMDGRSRSYAEVQGCPG